MGHEAKLGRGPFGKLNGNRLFSYGTFVTCAMLLALATLPACGDDGPGRSADAFCETMRSEKDRILAQLDSAASAAEASSDDFAGAMLGLGGSLQAIGELRTYFAKLSAVAPEEIRVEVEIVAEAMDRQFEAAGEALDNPLGSIGTALVAGLTTSGQLSSVDSFARANCGEGI